MRLLAFISILLTFGVLANVSREAYGNYSNPIVQKLYELEQDANIPTDEEIEDFLAEFYAAYEEAKANEQSLANRMLGAVAMGAGGVGGMMLASGLAEQKADEAAELDMTAYLATFKCDYGAGVNIKGGETNIELPGASELVPLYSEYVALANDLKKRKEQLGLKPGIESEKILDSATTGLYDDVSTGVTDGVYASLARALQDPDGEDAKKWAEQKEENAKKVKTGAAVGGVGVVGGVVGNVLINHADKVSDIKLPDISVQDINLQDVQEAGKIIKQKKLNSRGKK